MAGSASNVNSTALTDRTLSRQKYPNPFFDLSKIYMPKGIKAILRFCRMFFYRNEFINSVLHKMTEYPITPILFDNLSDATLVAKWKKILYHHLKVKTLLIEMGLDYHVFGNCFVSTAQQFKRMLTCPSCKEVLQTSEIPTLKFDKYNYVADCPKCNAHRVIFKCEDQPLKTINSINFVRWAPEQIDISYDHLTGNKEYFYTLPPEVKKTLSTGRITDIEKIPMIFIQSVKQNKKIQLDPNNIYHLKRPGIAEDDMGWGKPTILPALSLIWYMQTLRRGNEAIAMEHVVPMRAIFPASNGDGNPLMHMNLGSWKNRVQQEIDNYRQDPNYIGIFPIPLGYQSLGGDAKQLLTTAELKFLEETIINSLGVPLEFVKGGTTWTGSSISLRIVENGFMTYREQLEDFLNYFLMEKISGILSIDKPNVHFKRLRMSDDSETKNLSLQLNQAGKLADSILLQDFGYDTDENLRTMTKDLDNQQEIDRKRANGQAAIQGIMAIEQMRSQAKAEAVYLEEKSIINEEMFAEEIASEAGAWMEGLDTTTFMKKLTAQLLTLPQDQQFTLVNKLNAKMPVVAALLVQRLQLGNEALLQAMPQTVGIEQQQQEIQVKQQVAQRRASGRTSSTKHTASKKGEPK